MTPNAYFDSLPESSEAHFRIWTPHSEVRPSWLLVMLKSMVGYGPTITLRLRRRRK